VDILVVLYAGKTNNLKKKLMKRVELRTTKLLILYAGKNNN